MKAKKTRRTKNSATRTGVTTVGKGKEPRADPAETSLTCAPVAKGFPADRSATMHESSRLPPAPTSRLKQVLAAKTSWLLLAFFPAALSAACGSANDGEA